MAKQTVLADTARGREVIDAAAQVFFEHGYDGATIQDIADELGILKGSLYHYVNSKEDLLFAVVESPHKEALDVVHACESMGGVVAERLEALVRGQVLKLTENHVHWHVFLNDYESLNDEHKRHLAEERRSYQEYLCSLIEEGQANGSFRPDLDPTLVSLGILGMVNWASRWYRPEGGRTPTEIADEFVGFVFKGL